MCVFHKFFFFFFHFPFFSSLFGLEREWFVMERMSFLFEEKSFSFSFDGKNVETSILRESLHNLSLSLSLGCFFFRLSHFVGFSFLSFSFGVKEKKPTAQTHQTN